MERHNNTKFWFIYHYSGLSTCYRKRPLTRGIYSKRLGTKIPSPFQRTGLRQWRFVVASSDGVCVWHSSTPDNNQTNLRVSAQPANDNVCGNSLFPPRFTSRLPNPRKPQRSLSRCWLRDCICIRLSTDDQIISRMRTAKPRAWRIQPLNAGLGPYADSIQPAAAQHLLVSAMLSVGFTAIGCL